MNAEAETGVVLPRAKGSQGSLGAPGTWKRQDSSQSLCRGLRGSTVLLEPCFWTCSLQNRENKIPAALHHMGCGSLLWSSHGKPLHLPSSAPSWTHGPPPGPLLGGSVPCALCHWRGLISSLLPVLQPCPGSSSPPPGSDGTPRLPASLPDSKTLSAADGHPAWVAC